MAVSDGTVLAVVCGDENLIADGISFPHVCSHPGSDLPSFLRVHYVIIRDLMVGERSGQEVLLVVNLCSPIPHRIVKMVTGA